MLKHKIHVMILGVSIAMLCWTILSPQNMSVQALSSTSLMICAQDYSSAVSTITFPAGEPGTVVSNPYNDIDGQANEQTFGDTGIAKPVLTIVNTGASLETIWYNIGTFTNGVVSNEYYLINNKGAACSNAGAISNSVTFDTDTSTSLSVAAIGGANDTDKKDLYLKVMLGSVTSKSGTSTITILGEP